MSALIGIFLIVTGLFHSLNPYGAWYIHYGWQFKDAEPSDTYLSFLRVTGVVLAIVGVILLLTAIFSR